MGDDLIGYDAIGLSELIRKGDITPTDLLDIIIDRVEKINPKLNSRRLQRRFRSSRSIRHNANGPWK